MTNFQTTLDYFHSLIDHNGILQFTDRYQKAVESGYAVEDQARGLIVALWLGENELVDRLLELILAYRREGNMLMLRHHDGSFDEHLVDPSYREDASAEVLWALGELYAVRPTKEIEEFADYIISEQTKGIYSRAAAYALLGAARMGHREGTTALADKLVHLYQVNADGYWHWFEDMMTYANSLMPWSILAAYQVNPKPEYLDIGLKSLNFLYEHLRLSSLPMLVGNESRWWIKGETMPVFDQQPIDAGYLCLASLKAYQVTSEPLYLEKAHFYYSWFTGNNVHKASMIRPDGACHDGLGNMGVNLNAGAESTICYILATLGLAQHDHTFKTEDIAKIQADTPVLVAK